VPAQSASGPPVPVLGTQLVLLALPLQQQLVLVRAGRLILHAHHGRCACWMLHTFVLHARRLHGKQKHKHHDITKNHKQLY
jgi:hypothetical protein